MKHADHNTGITTLLFSTSEWVILSSPIEDPKRWFSLESNPSHRTVDWRLFDYANQAAVLI